MKALFSAILSMAAIASASAQVGEQDIIRIATDNTDLVLEVGPNKRVYQTYLGPKLRYESELRNLSWVQCQPVVGKHIPLRATKTSLSLHSESLMPTEI